MASALSSDLVKETETSIQAKGINPNLLPVGFIEKCLRHSSGNVQHSTMVCCKFLEFRERVNWSTCLKLNEINQEALRSSMYWTLGDKYGRAVFVFNPEHLDVDKCSIAEYQKVGMYLMEQLIQSEQIQNHGVAIVFDCRRISVRSMFSSIRYEDATRGQEMWQDAFPCRLRAIIIVGLSSAAALFIGLFLKFLPKRLRDRISFLSIEETAEELGVENLPASMGGRLKMPYLKSTVEIGYDGANEGNSSKSATTVRNDFGASENIHEGQEVEVCESGVRLERSFPAQGFDKEPVAEEHGCINNNSNNDNNSLNEEDDDDGDDSGGGGDGEWNWNAVVDSHIKNGTNLFQLNSPPSQCPLYQHNFSL